MLENKEIVFFCGKPGHFAAECRSRLAGDKTSLPRQDTSVPAHQPQTTSDLPKPTRGSSRPLAETTCFNCHQKGHISPNCPTKRMKMKKVRVDQGKIEILKENEVFGAEMADGRGMEMAEVSAESLDGSAEEEGCKGIDAVSIREGMPRVEMAAESQSDPSLKPLYNLAELDREGYHLVQGLVFRTRLDQLGNRVEQLCVPKTYRQRCLQAAHTSFGHQGRNKMALLLRP